ncbi:MAG: Kelch repeat-containing protein [Acidimicrobiia bacterium]
MLSACGSEGKRAGKGGSTSTSGQPSTTTRVVPPEAWEAMPAAPRELGKYAIWTGSEYLGGPSGCCDDLGGTEVFGYSPERGTWSTLAPFPLGQRSGEASAWTGHEMVVVGGIQARSATDATASNAVPTNTGAAYDPVKNTWRTIAPMPAAGPRTAAWTGHEVVALDATHLFRYQPAKDRWIVGTPPPFWRNGMTIVTSGDQLLLWAGGDTSSGYPSPTQPVTVHADGAAYDPTTNRWSAIPKAPVPARMGAEGVWTGNRMVVWGGFGPDGPTGAGDRGMLGKGASYDPATSSWQALPASPLKARTNHAMVWTGHEVLVWGGEVAFTPSDNPVAYYPRDGAAYDPATTTWRRMTPAPPSPPSMLTAFSAVWTGDVALFVGGADQNVEGVGPLGLSYTPGR